ncbi:MAG TPA: cation diffusion facilitator family transporter [Thermodesulfovibrionales bacterium]|nr:cation diffusion facilitator family transporter [Thermodesulfovibrionales bacterium]
MTDRDQKLVLSLTIAYFFIELLGGLYYRSLALVTDASFMAINVSGQFIALYIGRLAQRLPNKNKTFGYERAKVLSGLFNGMLVGFLLFYVFIEAYHKLRNPEPLEADKILLIAVIGLFVNAFGLIRLYKHSQDINIKGALLLILNDTLGSVGVIASSLIIRFTNLYFVDALAGVGVGLLAAYPTYFLIKDSVQILMEGNPAKIDIDEVEGFIYETFDNISNVKDMHIWGLSPEKIILAVRIRTNGSVYRRETMKGMKRALKKKFGFSDIYIELYEVKQASSEVLS